MNEKVRQQIRTLIHSDLLDEFERLAADVDDVWDKLNAEKDKTKAWNLAVRWATTITALTKLEGTLLSGVAPILEAYLAQTHDEVQAIHQQRREAEEGVYELRQSPLGTRPMNIPGEDDDLPGLVEEAKARRLEVLITTSHRLAEIAEANGPIREAIGQIRLSIRGLRAFQESRFPQPVKEMPWTNMAGPLPPDPTKDPFEAFADRWVKRMDEGPGPEPLSAVMLRLRRQPVNRDWDKEKRAHLEKVRQRTLEQLG